MPRYKILLSVRVGSAIVVEAENQAIALKMATLKYEAKLKEAGSAVNLSHIQFGEIVETDADEPLGIRKE